MNNKSRRNEIEKYLLIQGKADVEELVKIFHVSTMTIRRDLMQLEKEKKLVRTHGGAVPTTGLIDETPYSSKEGIHLLQKRAIAKQALNLIYEGTTIILDSGTTTLEIARLLKVRENITIITNDIFIAVELVNSKNHVIVSGGDLQNNIGAMLGAHTQSLLEDVNVDLFFLGAHAIHPKIGITAPTLEKARIKQLMIRSAKETWLVSDSSKLDKKSFAKVCSLNSVYGMITDKLPNNENLEYYHSNIILA